MSDIFSGLVCSTSIVGTDKGIQIGGSLTTDIIKTPKDFDDMMRRKMIDALDIHYKKGKKGLKLFIDCFYNQYIRVGDEIVSDNTRWWIWKSIDSKKS